MGRVHIFISICLLILTGNIFFQANAQEEPLYFEHLTRDDGLSSNRINYITEDSLGFIWFATEEGLNKFDGYGFETYNNFPSTGNNVPDNAVTCLLEDIKKPNFWLGTHQGLVYFDRYKKRFSLVLSKRIRSSYQNINISSLCMDPDNHLWIGTWNGLFIWDDSASIFHTLIQKNNNPFSHINTIFRDRKGRMWIGSEAGLFLFNKRDSTLQGFYRDEIRSVLIITEDCHNDFLLGTNTSGLYIIDGEPGGKIVKHLSHEHGDLITNRIYGIIEDTPGVFFLLNRDGGLYTYNKGMDILRYFPYDLHNPDGINSTALISGFKSSRNIIWIGTYNSGINYLDKAQKKFMLYRVNFKKDGLFNNNTRALAEDSEGYIWVGTKEGGGLSRFDKKNGTFRNYRKSDRPGGLRDDYIFSVCEMDRDHILVGTFRQGLAIFNKRKEIFSYFKHREGDTTSLYDDRVYCLFRDAGGTIWVGNFENLQVFYPVRGRFRTLKNILHPRCFCEEDKDRLWIGSQSHGVYLLNKRNGRVSSLTYDPADTNSLCSNEIFSLAKDREGYLWIGTRKGLNRYDPATGTFRRFTMKQGMPANWVRGVLIDNEGNIWASTTNGITKYERKKHLFHNYDVRDRLQGNEFERYVALKTHDGFMLFGGHNGFNMFRPEEIIDNKRIPGIFITDFYLFNREVPIGTKDSPLRNNILFTRKIILKHNQTAITLTTLALNYTSPEKNQYAYRLMGFDEGWIMAGTNRSAVYTNIPPGEYVFRVMGSNNDGYWNRQGASLAITVLPPPWKTGWAYFIYSLIFTGIFLAIRRILIIRIEQKQLLEYERKDKKRIQEINQEKLRFFTNISHEFRTPLTLIAGPLEKMLGREKIPEEEKNLLHLMKNNVNRLLMLVNELMEFRKAEHGMLKLNITENDPADTIRENIECFADKAKEKKISISFEEPDSKTTCWFDRNIINKVLFNLLSNAIKFTPHGGQIRVGIKHESGGFVTMTVANTGKGIPSSEQEKIFQRFYRIHGQDMPETTGTGIGLTFARRLMEKHKGTISVQSEPGKWTVFTIRFPAEKHNYFKEELADKGMIPFDEKIRLEPIHESTGTKLQKTGQKILIVEDNEELRNYLKRVFSEYDILTAGSGKEGLDKAIKEIPELVISDIMMPEMDGLEMCRHIKEHPATSHIPVILLTAKADIEHKIKGVETGADMYIEKPFRTDYLVAVAQNLIMQREKLRKKYTGGLPETDILEAALTVHDEKFIEKVRLVIEKNISDPALSVERLAEELGMSRSQLFRKFKVLFDLSPNELIRSEKLKYARRLLLQKEHNINEIADLAGFSSTSYFITSFKKQYGQTPARFLKNKQ